MSANVPLVSGYAALNTTHVLCALRAFESKARTARVSDAAQAAIDTYLNLSRRRVSLRTINNWRVIVARYGGIENVPANAFGALKSHPNCRRPCFAKLREIGTETKRVARELRGHRSIDPRTDVELSSIDRSMGDCFSRTLNDPVSCHLLSIEKMRRRLANVPIHALYKFLSPSDLEGALDEILARIKKVSVNHPGKAA